MTEGPPRRASGCTPAAEAEETSCPICLELITDEAFLDRCFHRFCYSCVARWINIVAKKHPQSFNSIGCPLCKSENFSILHDFNGIGFRQRFVNQDPENSFYSSAHIFRWQCYRWDPGTMHRKLNIPLYWKCCYYLKRNAWSKTWLRREIQALMQEEDVDVILHHLLGVIESFFERQSRQRSNTSPEEKRGEFRALVADAARPFVLGHTECFVDELELFLVSRLTIEAYDQMYMQCMDTANLGSASSCTNEDTTLDFFSEDLENHI